MLLKKVLQLKYFVKMENLVMKENHPLAIYGGIFVIMINAKKNQLMMMINQEKERKNLSSKA